MPSHTAVAFDADLEAIRSRIHDMGELVAEQIAHTGTALNALDPEISRQVIALDAEVDLMLRNIDTKVVETIACRQPLAVDLRELVSAFHIASDLERTGDMAKNVCKQILALDGHVSETLLAKMADLSTLVLGRLQRVLQGYLGRLDAEAVEVWESDKEIDDAHHLLFRELLVFMMSDPHNLTSGMRLLLCLKNIERMGDHATNIAEAVHYMLTGDRFIVERPKGTDASLQGASGVT